MEKNLECFSLTHNDGFVNSQMHGPDPGSNSDKDDIW